MEPVSAYILVRGTSQPPLNRAEGLLLDAWRASAIDLARLLLAQDVPQVVIATPTTDWIPADLSVIRDADPIRKTSFHFGERLAGLLHQYPTRGALYFGGGSAPLMDRTTLGMLLGLIERAQDGSGAVPSHIVLTNNLMVSDWAAISDVRVAADIIRIVAIDNHLGQALRESGAYEVRALSGVRPATSMDIDTPADLAILAHHTQVQPALRSVIESAGLRTLTVTERVIRVCLDPNKTIALIGRVSPLAVSAFEKAVQCQVTIIAEPRYGSGAGSDAAQRTPRSILAPWVAARWWEGFFADLAESADAVLFDNRIVLAALGITPTAADLFTSDVGLDSVIQNQALRELRRAIIGSRLPVLMGGNGLVSGALYALAEIIQSVQSAALSSTPFADAHTSVTRTRP